MNKKYTGNETCEFCIYQEKLMRIRMDTTWCKGCGTLVLEAKTKMVFFPKSLETLKNKHD